MIVRNRVGVVALLATGAIFFALACSSSNGSTRGPGATGSTCTAPAQCYPGVNPALIKGQVTCLTQLQNGYCTHTCTADTDCCTAAGECRSGLKEVCASVESAAQMYCVLSCDSADIAMDPSAGTTDPATYCQDWANPTFNCRSTGGGNPRKFCGP